MTIYAILDTEGICFNIISHNRSDLADIDVQYIKLQSCDEDLLYRKYYDGAWSDEKYLPAEPTIELTPTELYRAANLLNQAEILANQRQQDKVMAAILLEQVGGEANV